MKPLLNRSAGRIACFLAVLCSMAFFGPFEAQAQEGTEQAWEDETTDPADRFELEGIVVTASRTEEPVMEISKNVTVITEKDIEQAPSNNLVDLLAREAGIALRSNFGTDKQAVIDLRGMGDTAASNVVVMVDGIRLNLPDLSGADFSTIPLEQIERIEIVRGAGSVMYGNGAVGGVINIVTKKGKPETAAAAYLSYGSDDTFDTRASLSGGIQNLRYGLNTAFYDSDGYRDNGGLEKADIAGNLAYDPCDWLTLDFSGSLHNDDYGLPGPVSKDALHSESRRKDTDYPKDCGKTDDNRLSGGIDVDHETLGHIRAVRGYRSLNNDYIIGYSPQISRGDQKSNIDGFIKTLNILYEKDYSLYQREHKFQVGYDHYFSDYVRKEAPTGPRKNSRVRDSGVFVNNRFSFTQNLLFQCGWRGNRYNGRYRTDQVVPVEGEKYWVNGEVADKTWHDNACDLGVTYLLSPNMTAFASYATSFRVPNVDEMAEAEKGLKPQKGVHLDAGARFQMAQFFEASVTFFHITIRDEIYYSELNRNYADKTVRRGVETDVKLYPCDALFVWGNYSFTDARFDHGDERVPLVPEHKASVGIEWKVLDGLLLSLTSSYVGSCYDGNDLDNNRYDKLEAYEVFDGKLSYRYKQLKLFFGVNNIFDELYSTLSYSEAYYPMPGRTVYGGVQWVY